METGGTEIELNPLFERQNDLFGTISRVIDNIKKMGQAKWSVDNLKTRLERLEIVWNEFQDVHKKLIPHKLKHLETMYFSEEMFSVCEETYIEAKSFILNILRQLKGSSTSSVRSARSVAAPAPLVPPVEEVHPPISTAPVQETFTSNPFEQRRVSSGLRHLPQIQLPSFDGNYANWSQFRDLFFSMVNENQDISNVEKMHYLKMSLVKEPAQLIKNLLVTNDNFQKAWNLLVERYENRRVLVDAQLNLLFSARSIKSESATELKRLIGEIKEALGALESLGCPVHSWDHLLVYMVVRKLDPETIKDWEKSIGSYRDPSTFGDLEEFLVGRVYTLEAIEKLTSPKKVPQTFIKNVNFKAHNASMPTSGCSLCGGAHYIAACPTFLARDAKQRAELVTSRGLCFNCLGPHLLKRCRVSKRCRLCRKPHHTTLHEAPPEARNLISKDSTTKTNPPSAQPSTSHFVHSHHIRAPVLLATALVRVVSHKGESIFVRALIDQGSEVSFISESLVQRLRLRRRAAHIPITGIGSQQTSVSNGIVSVTLFSRLNPFISFDEDTLVLPKLTSYLPQTRSEQLPNELRELPLADPEVSSSRKIELILGVRVYSKIIQSGIRKSKDNLLIAQQTVLGWVLSGVISDVPSSHIGSYGFQCSIDREFLDVLQRFWRQEDESVDVPRLSVDERECEKHFVTTHSRDSNGRFVVRLPFRKPTSELGVSYSAAVQSFHRTELRFAKNELLKREYINFMREYISLGHMRLVTTNLDLPNFYLPHHGVIREQSSTTRLRVVFNGSQKSSSGVSLNDCLHTGPKLQTELIDVLMRWRRHPIVFACDLEKMYRQIRVHDDDLPFQRIVWREDSRELQTYELTTVTYGLSCAPFLAIRCIHQLANEHSFQKPFGASVLLSDTYVDDVLSGADDVDEVQEVIFQLNQVLTAGGFNARKWISNDSDALNYVPRENIAQTDNLNIEEDQSPRALGLIWNNSRDNFLFRLNDIYELSNKLTKRSVLSFIARLFDPLGWLSPLIVTAKIFMQHLWTRKLDWDESLPDDLALKWTAFINDFRDIPAIRVPRWLGINKKATSIQLHGFADASNSAFGAVVYIRVENNDKIQISLVVSKTKVAPLKSVTIPRLELCAAVILVRIMKRVVSVLDLQDVPIHLWSDSSVALSWICSHPGKWRDFVRNRVIEIQDLPQGRWSYVPGHDNPADLASRGVPIRQLQKKSLWWSGPSWLALPMSNWPSFRPTSPSEAERERRSTPAAHVAVPNTGWNLKDKYSSLNKLLRVTAWCFRFFKRPNDNSVPENLSPHEIQRALLFWVRECQQLSFADEIRDLQEGRAIKTSSALYRLVPFLDGQGFLRVTGRLRFSSLDWDEKHPIILPKKSAITSLVIDSYHRRTLHGGTQITLASIRRQFWIVGGRVPVRAFIHRCVVCARQSLEASQQLMGQLPPPRVTPSRPFLHTGVDYAGPFQIKTIRGRGGRTYKSYLILFVCLVTSAIHLEVATDYSTAGFLAAYKRFSGRRGLCKCLYSDRGTNLVGADRELRQMFSAASREWRNMVDLLSNDGTEWRFNPPAAPHFGGKWEAAVRSVKTHLKKVVGVTLLTYEEFSTVLIQIEAILNSRPLCALSEDPGSFEALTPAHFLVGSALTVVPENSLSDEKVSRLSRWQMLRRMVDDFWRKWEKFYLQQLHNATKWFQGKNLPEVGNLVLVKDERLPPAKWMMARILQIHTGADGHARVATIKTPSTTLVRPFTKLCLLRY